MLHTLLLQATTHTSTVEVTSLTNVYLALGGTLAAAIIAALASRNAAKTAKDAANLTATTAQKVADLSRQTTREVADLSAQVSRESATLAARTAQELKDKDYKNDYYKKIIDKRIKAIEQAEKLTSLFIFFDTKNNSRYYTYFHNNLHDNTYSDAFSQVINSALWYSKETFEAVQNFNNYMSDILPQARKFRDASSITAFAISKHKDIGERRDYIIKCLGKDMHDLYDIDHFLQSRFSADSIFLPLPDQA